MRKALLWVFGWPHELLHVLALRLIGRQSQAITHTHVDIPSDLPTGQFIFVAGLPALVFFTLTAASLQLMFAAAEPVQAVVWLAVTALLALAALGTVGDIMLIVTRLLAERFQPPEEDF